MNILGLILSIVCLVVAIICLITTLIRKSTNRLWWFSVITVPIIMILVSIIEIITGKYLLFALDTATSIIWLFMLYMKIKNNRKIKDK